MTPAEARDVVGRALAAYERLKEEPRIESVVLVGPDRLVVTFAQHRAVLTVGVYERQPS
jgi:hypothetical protein